MLLASKLLRFVQYLVKLAILGTCQERGDTSITDWQR